MKRFKKTYMAMLILFMAISGNLQAADENLAEAIAGSYPTPCLDAVGEAIADDIYLQSFHQMLEKQMEESPYVKAWVPGNAYYDQAFRLIEASVREKEKTNGKWLDYSSRRFIKSIVAEARPEAQMFLQEFVHSKAGQFFWESVVNGAFCSGFIESFSGKKLSLLPEQQKKIDDWKIKLEPLKKEFEAAPKHFDAAELKQIELATKIFFSGIDASNNPQSDILSGFDFSQEKMAKTILEGLMEVYMPLEEIFAAFRNEEDLKK